MALEEFAIKIFDDHFKPDDKYIIKYKLDIVKDIILAIGNSIPDNNYEEYLKTEETFEVFLLDELMPFISDKIRNMIFNLHNKDFFNRTGDSDIYYYKIPDNVVKYVIEERNKNYNI